MKSDKQKTIKVRIYATQQVAYSQFKEMTRREFNALTRRRLIDPNFGKRWVDEDLDGWLDQSDIDESISDLENISITEVKE